MSREEKSNFCLEIQTYKNVQTTVSEETKFWKSSHHEIPTRGQRIIRLKVNICSGLEPKIFLKYDKYELNWIVLSLFMIKNKK